MTVSFEGSGGDSSSPGDIDLYEPVGGRRGRLVRALAWLGGARLDVLENIPGSTDSYVGMGLVVLSTASIAGLSFAFAIRMALHANPATAAVLGIGWGLVILNLDRLLIVTLVKGDGRLPLIIGVLSRVVLAAFLGAVISTPITLNILQKEVDTELQRQQGADLSAWEETWKHHQDGLDLAKAQGDLAIHTAALTSAPVSANSAAVIAAQNDYDDAQDQVKRRADDVASEIDGTSASGEPGCAAICLVKKKLHHQARSDADAAKKKLDKATAVLNGKAATDQQQYKDLIGADNKKIKDLQAKHDATRSAYLADASDSGLLDRVRALWSLGDLGRAALITHLVLFLLFFAIEIFPVSMKSLMLLRPKSEYDDARKAIDKSHLAILTAKLGILESIAKEQKTAQIDAAVALNGQVLRAQKEVFQAHLDRWVADASSVPANRPSGNQIITLPGTGASSAQPPNSNARGSNGSGPV